MDESARQAMDVCAVETADHKHAVNHAGARHTANTERKCAVTGKVWAKSALIRFVVGPDRQVFADFAERLPGRGVWVLATHDTLLAARQRNVFKSGFKSGDLVFDQAPDDWVRSLGDHLAKRCLATLGLSRRAGALLPGFEKIRETLRTDPPHQSARAVLLIASDAARDSADKLLRLTTHTATHTVQSFDTDTISQATGLDNARFLLLKGPDHRKTTQDFSAKFSAEVTKYQNVAGIKIVAQQTPQSGSKA